MNRIALAANIFAALAFGYVQRADAQASDAQKAAGEIIKALGTQQYKLVWDQETSAWFKARVSQDAFLANMSMGRTPIGALQSSSLISSDHSTMDPASGYQGDIYAFTFKDKYPVGEFYERIVVIKDADGKYRLSGIFGSPVPKQ